MRRLTWMLIASVTASILAAFAALPYLPGPKKLPEMKDLLVSFTVDARLFFSFGTFWCWYHHMLIGAAIASSIVFVSLAREPLNRRILATFVALFLGGLFGAGGDALSDLSCLVVARSISPDYKVSIFQMGDVMVLTNLWPFWFSGGISAAVAIAHGGDQASWKRALVGTGLGGVFCTIARYVADTAAQFEQTMKVLKAGPNEIPVVEWSVSRLFAIDIALAVALSLAFYLATTIVRNKGLRGMNGAVEGRYWSLGDATVRIGFGQPSEITLPNDGSVAELHAQVQAHEGEHYVTALNGPVVVNGANVHQAWLDDGDTLTVGSYRLQYGSPSSKRVRTVEREYALLDELGHRIDLADGETPVGNAIIDKTGDLVRVRDLSGDGIRVDGTKTNGADLAIGSTLRIEDQTYRLVGGVARPTR